MFGCDLWVSGEMLEVVVIVGLISEGVDVLWVGVLLIFVVVYLIGVYDVDFGVMILVLYNLMFDNGIKIFGFGGYKLDDDIED